MNIISFFLQIIPLISNKKINIINYKFIIFILKFL